MTIEEAIESLENDISYTVPVRNGMPTISIDNPERFSEAIDIAVEILGIALKEAKNKNQ